MRLLGYYAFHSFINQVRKMLKTWVLIFFLVCVIMGGGIGFMAGYLSAEAEEPYIEAENSEEGSSEEDLYTEYFTEEAIAPSWEAENGFYEDEPIFPIGAGAMLELAFGAGSLLFFVYKAITAPENGSKIFLPADTILLFGSPLTPQAVLFFRLTIQMGTLLAFTIYMAIVQLPNLLNKGLAPITVVFAFLAWLIAMLEGTVLSEFLYLLSSVKAGVRKHLDKVVYAILALTAAGFLLFRQTTDLGLMEAAAAFFTGTVSRMIPLWGWVKAIPGYAFEENYLMAILMVLISALTVVLLLYASRRIPADFYEDAASKSAELAALRQKAEEHGITVAGISKKKKADVVRDGFKRGSGANVFFFKAMYNRWRFARFHFFTRTSWFYLAAGLGMAAIVRFIVESRAIAPITYVLGAMVFFRSLGNPLAEDTRMDFFRSIPESASAKVFYSLLGGAASCLLDLVPGLLAAGILLLANPLTVLGSLAFLVTIDFFSTIIGAFIDLSVPVNAGITVKQLVQILFLYFGLLPDVGCIAILTIKGHEGLGLLAASFVNILLGIAFFVVTPRLLEPVSRPVLPPLTMPSPEDQKAAGLAFGGCALALFAFYVTGTWSAVCLSWSDYLVESDWTFWLVNMLPLYLIGVPCAMLIFRMIPGSAPELAPLKPGLLVKAIFVCFFMLYSGNIIGLLLVNLLQRHTGGEIGSIMEVMPMTGALLPRVLFVVILAPLFEELVFRKLLIDRTRIYGEKLAILLSGILFGLFHGNLNQFFYTTLIGFCMAYIYLRTGKLRYSILLHMMVNLNGGIISVELANRMMGDMTFGEALNFANIPASILLFMVYVLIVFGIAVVGGVFLFSGLDRLVFLRQKKELPFAIGLKTAFANPPMILFILTMVGIIIYSLFI